jgi:hypothetical protein
MLVNEALDKPCREFVSVFESLGEHKAPFLLTFTVNSPDRCVSGAVIVENPSHNHLPF